MNEYTPGFDQMERAIDNAREAQKGWRRDEGEGLLLEEVFTAHLVAGCPVCERWDRWDNLSQRPGHHEIPEQE